MMNSLAVDMFITAQVAVVDTHKRRLLAANAGHCPLLLTRQDNTIEAVSPEGVPFGILADMVFEQVAIPLAEYTSVVLYTDGLTEARNAHGEFFGQERFLIGCGKTSLKLPAICRRPSERNSNHFKAKSR
jgi:serine phosphatase RsbU (regulator of sigma subunit)